MRDFRSLLCPFIQVVVDTSLESPAGLAIDWVTSKLYWTDAGKGPCFTCCHIKNRVSDAFTCVTACPLGFRAIMLRVWFLRYGSHRSFQRRWEHADCPDMGEPGPAQGHCRRPDRRVRKVFEQDIHEPELCMARSFFLNHFNLSP